jgi:microcystin-dependent protein
MPFNGSGVYSAPPSSGAFNPALSGQLATPDAWNTLLTDIANALSLAVCRDGQSSVIGNINMGGFKVTNMGAPAAASDAASKSYVDSASAIPPGVIWMWAGFVSQIPASWYLCDGSAKSRTADVTLYNAIGGYYGAGDGSTTFNLPDCRGRVVVMADGGTGRLPGWVIGTVGGEMNHTLSWDEMPQHIHGISQSAHAHGLTDPGHQHIPLSNGPFLLDQAGINVGNLGTTGIAVGAEWNTTTNFTGISMSAVNANVSIQNSGSSWAHNNLQPTIAMNFIIKR